MRTIWKGSISFGLIAIPVRLVSAARRRQLRRSIRDKTKGKRPAPRPKMSARDTRELTDLPDHLRRSLGEHCRTQ